MKTDLGILEDRVRATVDRLRELDAERSRLSQELDGLRRRMTDLREENTKLSGGLPDAERRTRIRRVETALVETIEALREESDDRRTTVRNGPT